MPSFGEQLKRERRLRNVSLEEISKATKISMRYLRALEADEFSQLPGGVFDRGYVRAYAQFVGLDEEATVEAYVAERGPEEVEQRDDGLDALRTPVEIQTAEEADRGRGVGGGRALRLVAAVIVVVGVASLTAWAVSRYFSADESDPASRKQLAQVSPPLREESNQIAEAEPQPDAQVATRIETAAAPATDSTPTDESRRGAEQRVDPPHIVTSTSDTPRSAAPIEARILVDRAATGRVNCDNRRVETLDGLRPGTELRLQCQRFLLLNVRDGGAVRVGLNGEQPLQLTADGEPLDNYGIYP